MSHPIGTDLRFAAGRLTDLYGTVLLGLRLY